MLFGHFNNDDLERWCYASPLDKAASAEMLRRTCSLLELRDDEFDVLEHEADGLKADKDALAEQVVELEDKIAALESALGV